MHDLILRLHKEWMVSKLGWVSCCLLLGSLTVFGQPSSLTPQIMSVQQQVKWLNGPAKAELGVAAEMEIPAGYRFTDAAGARALLERMKNQASPGLVGILAPESGEWWVVLEYSNMGYMQPYKTRRINTETIITGMQNKIQPENKVRAKQGVPPITAVTWDLAPEYDATNNSLAYAIQIETLNDKVIKPVVHFFGRNGTLSAAVVVLKAKATPEKTVLKELFQQVSFKPGHRYADFQEGDKVANTEIYQLITGEEHVVEALDVGWKGFLNRYKIWFLSGLAVCVLAVVTYLVTKEIRSLNPRPIEARNASGGKKLPFRRSVKATDAAGRRRAFDYQKFYTDMMMQVSTRSYTGLVINPQEEPVEVEEAAQAPQPQTPVADTQRGAASELIARQKDFIEEQRRLMQQQTKLIEERSKLIEEKNQLLAKQSEMIENHLL